MALFVVIPMNLLQGLAPTVNHAVGLFGVLCLVLDGATFGGFYGTRSLFLLLVVDAPIPMSVANAQGDIDYLNRSFQEVLGYSLEDLPNLEAWWEKAYPDPDVRGRIRMQWNEAVVTAVAAGTPVPPTVYPVGCKDGRTAAMEIQASIIGEHVLAMFSDVSDRQRGEEALRQTQKLESLGVLAGGIAHDFNNLLGAMLGNLDLAQMKLSPGAASGRYLENLESTIGKAVKLTRQMLAYSGKGRFVVEPLDLNRHVGEISHLLAVSISKKVRLDCDLAPDLPAIEADRAQLQQVVMNLAINASEAIGDEGGAITIATGLRDIAKKEAETAFVGQDLARIFDPFFSTKGSGRGLGLSAMLGILRGHQAGIEIRSEPGAGSDFQICFRASPASLPWSSWT